MPHPEYSSANEPDRAAQIFVEAVEHHRFGRLTEAEQTYRRVLETTPTHGDALRLLGALYLQSNRSKEAIPFLESALQVQPGNQEVHNNLGIAWRNIKQPENAVACFRQALAINPSFIEAQKNLGKALRDKGHYQDALTCFENVHQANPNIVDICFDMGRCYFELANFQQAVVYFGKTLAQAPNHVDALSAMGASLWFMGRRVEARAYLERALQITPADAKAIINFGEFLYDEGKIDEALDYFNRGLTLAPQYPYAIWRKSFALLAKGEYREGWKLYAQCLGHGATRGPNKFAPALPWDGTPAPDKHLLIWCEQGLGDSLQFIRYAKLCKERMGKVSAFCPAPLVRLFKNQPYIDHASDACDPNSFDEHVPMMNLPHIFKTTLETIPADVPYLKIAPDIEAKWNMKFTDTNRALKVGLVWAGGAHIEKARSQVTDAERSLKPEQMKHWLKLQGTKFYSLQKDKPAEQIAALGLENHLTDLMNDVADFADTAALIQNLDLVITVDTSVAHLAGALGKPVWIMSRYNADWRWLQNTPTNPWYPTARIFGQPAMGDWDSVIANVEQALIHEIVKGSKAI